MRKLPGQPGGALLATGEARRVTIGGGGLRVVICVVIVSSVVFGMFLLDIDRLNRVFWSWICCVYAGSGYLLNMQTWSNKIGARATKTVQKLVGGVDIVKSVTLSLWMCDDQWMVMVCKNDIGNRVLQSYIYTSSRVFQSILISYRAL